MNKDDVRIEGFLEGLICDIESGGVQINHLKYRKIGDKFVKTGISTIHIKNILKDIIKIISELDTDNNYTRNELIQRLVRSIESDDKGYQKLARYNAKNRLKKITNILYNEDREYRIKINGEKAIEIFFKELNIEHLIKTKNED